MVWLLPHVTIPMDYLCLLSVQKHHFKEIGGIHQEQCNAIGEELEPHKCTQRFDIN